MEALPTFIIFKDGKPYDRFVSWSSFCLFSS
jgi:thioredoxin-like negative regulator of GroEL